MAPSRFFSPKSLPWSEPRDHRGHDGRDEPPRDPQVMSQVYGQRMRSLMPTDRWVSLSRRDLERPAFRVTRNSQWTNQPNPWKEKDKLPLHRGGLFADLIYGNEPRLLNVQGLPTDDPAHAYVDGMQSILAIPHYDAGESLNMIIQMRANPEAFDPEELPELVWVSNLYGRATQNLVLAEQVKAAFEAVDAEMKTMADIQRSLLPSPLPTIPTWVWRPTIRRRSEPAATITISFRCPKANGES